MCLKQCHCEFLEYWNTQKSVCRIWQHFSCLLDEGIAKILKKLNFHDGFLSYLQNSTANSACLSLPSKSHRENLISSIFLESPHQVDMKNVVKSSKHFFRYFNTLETHSELWCISLQNVFEPFVSICLFVYEKIQYCRKIKVS